jgi:hypothetical protein
VGKPDDLEDWVPVVVGEWGRRYGTLYVARGIWDSLRPQARDFTFYLSDWGRCRVFFDRPLIHLRP